MAGVQFFFYFLLHGVQASFYEVKFISSPVAKAEDEDNSFLKFDCHFEVLPTTHFFTLRIQK